MGFLQTTRAVSFSMTAGEDSIVAKPEVKSFAERAYAQCVDRIIYRRVIGWPWR